MAGAAFAQTTPAAPAQTEESTVEEVVVTGYRAALQSALSVKRNSNVMVDAINAEDIADFPDANLAESLQRLPGVSIDRDNGEGRTITVRGLGPDFTRVRLNGLEALSTAGSNDSGTSGNRTRGFDFSVFASELFNSLKVQKTASAETDEGSLGATVDLQTGRPLDFKGRRLALSVQDAYYEAGKHHNPRIASLVSDRWDTNWGQFGALFSLAYNERNSTIDSYARQAGQSDYTYRGATFAGTSLNTNGTSILQRQGFAAPTGTACNNGVVPGVNVTNVALCNALRGSNPTAYALINNPIGAQLTRAGGVTTTTAPGSLIRIPALPTINQQELEQERLGITGALQWQPTDRTKITFDGVYSRFYNSSTNYQISAVGLNRNNTTANYNTAGASSTPTVKRGLYAGCNYTEGSTGANNTLVSQPLDCGQSLNGLTPLAGYQFSYNPNNRDPYEYYNNPLSPGYIASADGLAMRDLFIGRPSVKLIDAALSESGANASYLKLGNVDIRSAADQQYYTTFFQQGSLTLEHEFTDKFRMTALWGKSRSYNKGTGLLADYLKLDSGNGTAGNDYFVYDERVGGSMPLVNFGFDATNPANWDFVKGYSSLRIYRSLTDNRYTGTRFDFTYDADDNLTIKFGATQRKYGFFTSRTGRAGGSSGETLNPSFKEAGSSVAATSRLINWGNGLDVPAGTTTAFLAPDLDKFTQLFDFNCECINKWGDWRTSTLSNPANTYGVDETDTGAYVQFDYRTLVLDRELRGNVGTRYAITEVDSYGFTNLNRPIYGENKYTDVLPSLNMAYDLTDSLLLRFGAAKVMARPLLANLAPSITAFSAPNSSGSTTGGTLTVGNPKLQPFRAINLDLSLEWYFGQGSLISFAVFDKDVRSFPQTVVSSSTLADVLPAQAIADLIIGINAGTGTLDQKNAQVAYINNQTFDVRQYRDAPGGYIRGFEIGYQQNLTFLPWFLDKLGVQANYTHLESELSYIIDPGALEIRNSSGVVTTPGRAQVVAPGPFTGASPDSFNVTVYYETDKWSARVSTAYRAKYYTQYPIASGSCNPGYCDSPLVNDFLGSESTTNVDASFSYKFTSNLSFSAEALNLTNETSNRFGYADDPVVTQYAAPGRQFFMGVRYVF
ncbi:TonB-dependent receptor [Caulobacter hibisci]|uniref:TonB-dependent receptor n=2 Tax=Caulobacter hibisci TaxID=2035993 RepID=A0ABS0SZR6_9CAUL|nr:TonB-dependent receptor [Caulobacter hibisci]